MELCLEDIDEVKKNQKLHVTSLLTVSQLKRLNQMKPVCLTGQVVAA